MKEFNKHTSLFALLVVVVLTVGSHLGSSADDEATNNPAVEAVRFAPNHDIKKENRELILDGDLFSGLLVSPNSNGELIYTLYAAGLKSGPEISYFANGQRSFERIWVEGKREGDFISWWPSGAIKQHIAYVDDLLEGEAVEWFASGAKSRVFNYVEGHEEGPQMMWYEDGSIRANYHVKQGKRYGSIGTKGCGGLDEA